MLRDTASQAKDTFYRHIIYNISDMNNTIYLILIVKMFKWDVAIMRFSKLKTICK